MDVCRTQGRAVWNLTTAAQQWEVEFGVIPDGQYHVYYVPLYPFKYPIPALQYNLTQMRIRPVKFGLSGQAVKIDWIRVVRGVCNSGAACHQGPSLSKWCTGD